MSAKLPLTLPTTLPAFKKNENIIINTLVDKLTIEDDIKEENIDNDFNIDVFNETEEEYDKFDKESWAKGNGYKIPNFKLIEDYLEGAEHGFYLFAGESNSGKTAIMSNILKDICSCRENKLFGIYYSLDDTKSEIIPRFISMDQSIPISVSSKPQRYKNMINDLDENSATINTWLEKRQIGLNNLKKDKDCFKIVDTEKITNSNELRSHIKKMQLYVKSIDPQMNIAIAIDAFNDIKLSKISNKENEDEEKAKFVKDLSNEFKIMVFSSCHLRKLNANRRPTLDDLRNANTLIYEASLIWLIYNDVSKNKNAANIYWTQEGCEDKHPIIEMDWGKNKKSSFKGRTFYYFYPNFSKVVQCDLEINKRFDAVIYQS